MQAKLAFDDYIWWQSDVSIGAVSIRLSEFFPLYDELETHRQNNHISFYYDIDLFHGGIMVNRCLWYLVSCAIGNLVQGLTDLSNVYDFSHYGIVMSTSIENILLGD